MTLYMIDLEGTITNNHYRQALITGYEKNWRAYYAALIDDLPNHNVVDFIKKLPIEYVRIYTTRMPNKYCLETEWLKKNGLEHYGEGMLRRANTQLPGPQLLKVWCEQFKPNVVIDDRADNRGILEGMGIRVYGPDQIDEVI